MNDKNKKTKYNAQMMDLNQQHPIEHTQPGADDHATLYPEFVPSFDNWLSDKKQKKRANELEKL